MTRSIAILVVLITNVAVAAESPAVVFQKEAGKLEITIGGAPFATYVWDNPKITRPYFRHLRTPGGTQATRNDPPMGKDPTDHDTFHPGVWLAFADINGSDSWRIKAPVRHVKFVDEPKGGAGTGTFTVVNQYLTAAGQPVCQETSRCTIAVRPAGYLLLQQAEFTSADADFTFGDQEEMGFGVRMAGPLSVSRGGRITNSDGLVNESKAWGKQADWCDYSGVIDGKRVGLVVMPDPSNFRRSWFHARDYGVLVANPFGRRSFGGGERSQVVVKKGEKLTLGFGVLVYSIESDKPLDIAAAYQDFLKTLNSK